MTIVREIFFIYQRLFSIFIRGPRRPWLEVIHHLYEIGLKSTPIILFAAAVGGFVATSEMAYHMKISLGALSMIPGFCGQFVFRELGVAIAILLLIAKSGAAMAAETAAMKTTEQLDALRLLRIDPISYVVFPRFIAFILACGALTALSVFTALGFAAFASVMRYQFSFFEYVQTVARFVGPIDVLFAVSKGLLFGSVIPVICCAYGFRCNPGAAGVGLATTESVVTSSITVLILDCILNAGFSLFSGL